VTDFYGWQYKDGRDLSGFLDGTMNINGDDERTEAGVNSIGGSYLIHQRWEHNLEYFNSLPLKEQEDVFGRSKDWSAEQDAKKMKIQAHVARMRDQKFQPIPIVRQSMPYGNAAGTKGLLFLGYSSDASKFDQMLDQMTEKNKSDLVMTYSKCVAGNYYYIPSKKELSNL
jgi:porphyrinogen peroxidase